MFTFEKIKGQKAVLCTGNTSTRQNEKTVKCFCPKGKMFRNQTIAALFVKKLHDVQNAPT
jgi:hypothetical protein